MMGFSWIIVGISEEIVFRGFFQTALAKYWHGTLRVFDTDIPIAGLIAALIFTIAHISFRDYDSRSKATYYWHSYSGSIMQWYTIVPEAS
jgi:membrane protease YdiL (CAAX protease family)